MAMWIKGECDGCQCTVCSNCGSIIPTETAVSTLSKEDNRYCYFCGRKMDNSELASDTIYDLRKVAEEIAASVKDNLTLSFPNHFDDPSLLDYFKNLSWHKGDEPELANDLDLHLDPYGPVEPFDGGFLYENISHTAFKEPGDNDE